MCANERVCMVGLLLHPTSLRIPKINPLLRDFFVCSKGKRTRSHRIKEKAPKFDEALRTCFWTRFLCFCFFFMRVSVTAALQQKEHQVTLVGERERSSGSSFICASYSLPPSLLSSSSSSSSHGLTNKSGTIPIPIILLRLLLHCLSLLNVCVCFPSPSSLYLFFFDLKDCAGEEEKSYRKLQVKFRGGLRTRTRKTSNFYLFSPARKKKN